MKLCRGLSFFFFSSRRRHTRYIGDWSSDVCSSDLITERPMPEGERLDWMAYRKHGKAKTIENVCLDLPGSAPAFVITLPMVTASATARSEERRVGKECRRRWAQRSWRKSAAKDAVL